MTAEPDTAVKPVGITEATAMRVGPVCGRTRRAHKLNATGETRLHVASRLNKTADVITLLMEGADINARDYAGLYSSPLATREESQGQLGGGVG